METEEYDIQTEKQLDHNYHPDYVDIDKNRRVCQVKEVVCLVIAELHI